MFTVLVAHFVTLTERLTWARAIGVLFGVFGVVVLVGSDAVSGVASESLPGQAACLLAALSYAFAGIYGRRFKSLPSLHVATGQITGATLVMLPIAAIAERFWTLPPPSASVWGAFAGIALLCTVLAYILYFRILATAGATSLLLVTFLLPISALLLGRLILGENIQPTAFVGMALIGVGLAAIDGRAVTAIRARPATT